MNERYLNVNSFIGDIKMNGSKMEIHLFSRLASIISIFTFIIGFISRKTRSLSLASYVCYLCAQ